MRARTSAWKPPFIIRCRVKSLTLCHVCACPRVCRYDGPFHALQWVHGGGSSTAFNSPVKQDPSSFIRFNQSEFASADDTSNAGRSGLDLIRGGFAYIPQNCRRKDQKSPDDGHLRAAKCKVHVFAHGCGMAAYAGPTPYAFNDTYARRAGFNEVAEANNIVMVYPQLHYGDTATCASEADDCWDQGGSTGDSYSDKAGAQTKAVMAMVQKLLASPK